MTVYGVIVSATTRKVRSLLTEYKRLVQEATAKEHEIFTEAETKVEELKNDLVNKIARI